MIKIKGTLLKLAKFPKQTLGKRGSILSKKLKHR